MFTRANHLPHKEAVAMANKESNMWPCAVKRECVWIVARARCQVGNSQLGG